MENVPNKIIERIRKMLALGRNAGATEGERDNAMRMAHKLLAAYNLELAEIDADPAKKETMEPRAEYRATFYGRPWARNVAHSIARLMACNYLTITATKGKETTHIFLGRHTNAVTAAYLAEYLVNSIDREGHRQTRQGSHDNAWFRAFAWGATVHIRDRVTAMLANKDEQTAMSDSKALVLANFYQKEMSANQEYQNKLYPVTKNTRGGKGISNAEGFARGHEYGGSLSLNQQLK